MGNAWKKANPGRTNELAREWARANRDRINARKRELRAGFRKLNPLKKRAWSGGCKESKFANDPSLTKPWSEMTKLEKARVWDRERYKRDKAKRLAYSAKLYAKNPDPIKHRTSAYAKENRDKVNSWKRTWQKQYCNSNPSFRIARTLRVRVKRAIMDGYGIKAHGTIELIGCSYEGVVQHLERQFSNGMTWDNYGAWHIDHIRPCSSFDLTDPEQQKLCFNYTNLQPLWAIDNIKKGDKYEIISTCLS